MYSGEGKWLRVVFWGLCDFAEGDLTEDDLAEGNFAEGNLNDGNLA